VTADCRLSHYKGEVAEGLPSFSAKELAHTGQELSDVLLYLLRLADKCHIDLPRVRISKRCSKAATPIRTAFTS